MLKILIVSLLLLCAAPALQAQEEPAGKPGISTSQTITLSAQIVALDKENRLVTLKGPQGNERTIQVGDAVQRLDEFEVGDIVVAEYIQELSLQVVAAREGTKPGQGAIAVLGRASEAESPGMVAAETSVSTAQVMEIDLENNTFKLDWGDGDVQQYVARDPENLKKAKPGDFVIATYTEALALQLQQAPEQE